MDLHQTREQTGFRNGFSTIDHIQAVSQLMEKANEHNIPLWIAFVDYEKAFDSIEFNPMFTVLGEPTNRLGLHRHPTKSIPRSRIYP